MKAAAAGLDIGSIVSGIPGSTIGLHDTIWVGAILFFMPAIFLLLSPVRALRVVPAQVDDKEVAAPA